MDCHLKEERVQLALKDFKNGQHKTKKAAALAYDIPETTLCWQIEGITSHSKKTSNYQKLSTTEESTLSEWILDMDKRGLPVQLPVVAYLAQLLLSACLSSQSMTIGGHWVNHYIKHHPELKSKYTWKYDYQCAKCENPKLI